MEKLSRELTIKYAFLQGTFWISECCIFSFAAVFLHWKNFSNVQIGLVMSLASVLSILMQPIIAALADKSKTITLREIVLLLMFVVLALAVILVVLPESFLLIGIIYILINALDFTLIPLFNALAVEYINKGVPMNYGLARGMGSVAFAIMSISIGIAVNHFGPGVLLSFFIGCHCLLILSTYNFKLSGSSSLLLTSNKTVNPLDIKSNTESSAPSGLLSFLTNNKSFSLLLIGIIFIYYGHNIINTYLINIVENVGGNSTDLGISLFIAAALELPAMAAFIFVVKKISCSTLIKISAFFFMMKAFLAWIAPNVFMVYFSMSFQMLSYAIYTPASVYYVNSIINEKDKVKGQTMIGVAAAGIAGTIGNLTGGKLLDTVGVSNMLLTTVISSVIGFAIILFATESSNVKESNKVVKSEG